VLPSNNFVLLGNTFGDKKCYLVVTWLLPGCYPNDAYCSALLYFFVFFMTLTGRCHDPSKPIKLPIKHPSGWLLCYIMSTHQVALATSTIHVARSALSYRLDVVRLTSCHCAVCMHTTPQPLSASTTGCESVGNSSVHNTKQSTDTQGHVCTCVVSWLVCELHMCIHVCTCKACNEATSWLSQHAGLRMRTCISAVFLLCAVYYHA
jgi:hypothetical protein